MSSETDPPGSGIDTTLETEAAKGQIAEAERKASEGLSKTKIYDLVLPTLKQGAGTLARNLLFPGHPITSLLWFAV